MAERQSTDRPSRATAGADIASGLPIARPGHGSPAFRHREALHVCPTCESLLVQPVDWTQADAKHWQVELRCPDCEWRGAGIYGQDVVDRYDETLDEAMQAVLDDLQLLTRANMEEQVEHFVTALHADLVLPEDF